MTIQGSLLGATSNEGGYFRFEDVPTGDHVLRISAIGHHTLDRPIKVQGSTDLGRVMMTLSSHDLNEVVVTGSMREVSRMDSPVPVEIISPKLFKKDPEPSLLASIGMVNGVRPQLNCSICNTGDIHINGIEGPYTLVLVDGMPIVSSLGTVYGLSGIPTGMVERVEVVKGPAAALYGSEAMGGIINVITRDPMTAPKAIVDVYGTTWQELNLDAAVTQRIGRAKGLFSLNGYDYSDPRDQNDDGFTDLTIQERVSLFTKWSFDRPSRKPGSIAARYMYEDRWGGQMEWSPEFAGGDSIYGEHISTRRWEVLGHYAFPCKEQITTQFSLNGHSQDSYYGMNRFDADQQVAFGQVYWSKRASIQHGLLVGSALRYTDYDDNTPGTADLNGQNAPQRTMLPGLFVQDEWRFRPKHTLLAGYRVDHHPVHGLVHSPRLAYKWRRNDRETVRMNLGTGFRVVNLFTEDHAALTGSRQVIVTETLLPERSIGGSNNYLRSWTNSPHFFLVDATLFHTRFNDQIIADLLTDPDKIIYANLKGHAVSQGVSINGEAALAIPVTLRAGISWMDVHRMDRDPEGNVLHTPQLFAPAWSGTFTCTYKPGSTEVSLTSQWNGPMHLPVVPNDPRPATSPWHAIINVKVAHPITEGIDIYGGVKNLMNFVPKQVLLRSHDPFDQLVNDPLDNPDGLTFDTSYMYASLQGIRGYLGMSWTLW